MAPVLPFERLPCMPGEIVTITIDGEAHEVDARWTVAAALIAHGHTRCRCTPAGQARGPFCMSGACFECLVDIDRAEAAGFHQFLGGVEPRRMGVAADDRRRKDGQTVSHVLERSRDRPDQAIAVPKSAPIP